MTSSARRSPRRPSRRPGTRVTHPPSPTRAHVVNDARLSPRFAASTLARRLASRVDIFEGPDSRDPLQAVQTTTRLVARRHTPSRETLVRELVRRRSSRRSSRPRPRLSSARARRVVERDATRRIDHQSCAFCRRSSRVVSTRSSSVVGTGASDRVERYERCRRARGMDRGRDGERG